MGSLFSLSWEDAAGEYYKAMCAQHSTLFQITWNPKKVPRKAIVLLKGASVRFALALGEGR